MYLISNNNNLLVNLQKEKKSKKAINKNKLERSKNLTNQNHQNKFLLNWIEMQQKNKYSDLLKFLMIFLNQ